MTEVVLDASVVLKWFAQRPENGTAGAQVLRAEYEAGRLGVVAPAPLFLELLNAAGRGWRLGAPALLAFTQSVSYLRFEIAAPDLFQISAWMGRGLTAYDASYVALAESRGIPLITADTGILAVARGIASPLS